MFTPSIGVLRMQGLQELNSTEIYLAHANSIKYWKNGNQIIVGCHAAIQTVVSCGERWTFSAQDTDWLGEGLKYCNTVLDLSAKFGTVGEGGVCMFIDKKMTSVIKTEDFETKAPLLEGLIKQSVKGRFAFQSASCLKVKPQKDGSSFYQKDGRAIFYLNAQPAGVVPVDLPAKEDLNEMPLNILGAEEFITKFFL